MWIFFHFWLQLAIFGHFYAENNAKMPVHKSHDRSGGRGGVCVIIIFDHNGGGGVTKDPKLDHEIYERPLTF